MIKNTSYFVLFSNCILVNGKTKSTICDLQSQRYKLIPNELYNILSDNRDNGYSLIYLFNKYKDEIDGLKLYIDLLQKEGFGFLTNLNPKAYFPSISHIYEHFGKISNSIID